MYKRAQRGMGYLSQEPSVFQRLTVEQNLLAILETMRDLSRAQRRETANRLVEQFGLSRQARQEARTLSGGRAAKARDSPGLDHQPKADHAG